VPAPPVVDRAFTAIEQKRDSDRDVYAAFWLAAGAGLRRKEILNCEWRHLVERQGQLWVWGGTGKNGEPIRVPVQERAAEALRPLREEGWVIKGRSYEFARRLNLWLRLQGWQDTEKVM